jgi:hypothetical protein
LIVCRIEVTTLVNGVTTTDLKSKPNRAIFHLATWSIQLDTFGIL